MKTTYEETEDEDEIHKFNSTICDFLTTPEKKRKKCQKTCTKNIKVGVRGSREREGGKNSLILWA